jgi:hypothetical protein
MKDSVAKICLLLVPGLLACGYVQIHHDLVIRREPPIVGPPPRYTDEARLDVERPLPDTHIVSLSALAEVAGVLHRTSLGRHDIVIVIDSSPSAFLPSEADIDGDGIIGEDTYAGRLTPVTTDPDDIVLEAERAAALTLMSLLDPERTRTALIRFGTTPWVVAFLGPPDRTRKAIENLRLTARRGTDILRAVMKAADIMGKADARVTRSILLLSDGEMSLRVPAVALEHYRRRVVHRLRDDRIRIFAFGVGPIAADNPEFLQSLAEQTGGAYSLVEAAGDVRVELPMINLAGLSDIEMLNTTSGDSGRAVRVFPDGSFDGYVVLQPGHNALLVRAALADGSTTETRLTVRYTRPDSPSDQHRAERDRLLERMKQRTLESDLARRAQVVRRAARLRHLEIELDHDQSQ